MAEAGVTARPTDPVGRVLYRIVMALAIFGGLLSCAMAALVAVSVAGRYLFSTPVPGDYDLVGIICGCAIFAFLPYCQFTRGNVIVDFFTASASPRVRAILDTFGTLLYLVAAMMFTWRLIYGMLEMMASSEVIASFNFYRWWTLPFDIACMIVLILTIIYTFTCDAADARSGQSHIDPTATSE